MSDDVDVKALVANARHAAADIRDLDHESHWWSADLIDRLAAALEAAPARPVPPADVKALVAEARSVVRDAGSYNFVPEPRLILELAAALEAVSARPLVADREALEGVLGDFVDGDWRRGHGWDDPIAEAAEHLLASGVVQSKGDVQAEALEEAADSSWANGEYTTVAGIRYVSERHLLARAAAYRTPASPNSEEG